MSVRVLVLFAACLASGAALKCYNCVSDGAAGYCSDSHVRNGKIYPADCPLEELSRQLNNFASTLPGQGFPNIKLPLVCVKKYYYGTDGVGRTERKCMVASPDVCKDSGSETINGRLDYCGTCDYDGCNAAVRFGRNYLWLLLPLAALLRHS